jgi:hypothetical protein
MPPTAKKRAGDPASQKLHIVCKKCNERWMGEIETAALPVMTPLILGNKASITQEDKLIIARWATLKTIIGEYDDLRYAAITASERDYFYKEKSPLPNSKIWIGYFDGTDRWRTRYRHHGIQAAHRPLKEAVVHFDICNTQSSTFVGGKLFIYVASSSFIKPFDFGIQGFVGLLLRQIWPPSNQVIDWPLPPMNDEDAQSVSDSLWAAGLRSG